MQVAKAGAAPRAARAGVVVRAAARANWLPGSDFPAHLENCKLPGCYGFDPLGLGADPERLKWFAEAERVHARWAMLGVAGILLQVRLGQRCRVNVGLSAGDCAFGGYCKADPTARFPLLAGGQLLRHAVLRRRLVRPQHTPTCFL